jgi:tetratricopeptide (TPR) repeat protein
LSNIEQLFGINEELRYKRFGIYVRQNKQKQAEESIQELLNLYPAEMDYILAAIQLYENNAQYSQAIQLCNIYTNTGNNPADIMYAKARLFAKMDMVDSVTITLIHIFSNTYVTQFQKHEILEKLVLRNTQSPIIYEKRYEIVDKIYTQVPNDEVLHTVLARYYSQNNNSEKALPHLYYAIKHEKSNSSHYNQIIEIETKNKQWDSIISVASTAIILFPNNADMYVSLSKAYMQKKQYDLAISTLQDGLDVVYILKQKRLFYMLLAESLYAVNSLESANQTFEKALLIDSSNTHTICIYAYYAALQQQSNKANTLLQSCNNCTQNIDCKLAQALLFTNQMQYEKGLEIMNSIDTAYDDTKYLELLGDVLFLSNKVNEAENAWKKANDKGSTIDIQLKKVFLQKK